MEFRITTGCLLQVLGLSSSQELLVQSTLFIDIQCFFPTVDPPANIAITDPGFLGYVSIHWTRPAGLQNLTGCTVRYQLRYYDTYEERWRVRILENSQNTPHRVSFVLLSAHKHLYMLVYFLLHACHTQKCFEITMLLRILC